MTEIQDLDGVPEKDVLFKRTNNKKVLKNIILFAILFGTQCCHLGIAGGEIHPPLCLEIKRVFTFVLSH